MDLIYLNGEKAGTKFPLTPPGVSIGREVDNDIQLLINGVSRYHAMLSFNGNEWYLEDLGSTNGTRVDQQKITGKVVLKQGNVISVGDQKFQFGEETPEAKQKTQTAAADITQVDIKLETIQDFASQLRKSKNSIFGASQKFSDTENKGGKKKILGNIIFTLLVITLPLVCIFGYMVMMDQKNVKQKQVPVTVSKVPFLFFYEKTVVTPDNVFRFEAKVEEDTAVFVVDDLKYGRHNVVKQGNLKVSQIDNLKDAIRNTNFMKLSNEPANAPAGPKDESRVIMISIDSKFNKVEVRNTYAQTSFETVERAIADFAEEFDVRVNSLTEEEMRAEAESAFRRAEELLANYQAAPENIRNAILRYGNAMKYYEQFEPKPREWDICRKQLEKANKIYKNIYEGLVFNIQRYNKLRQFDKASGECQKMLELVDPDSPDFRKYKAYKVAFDKQLRRKK